MDTNDAASAVGTTPKILRAFLRSPVSTFVSVGSGSRYSFTERDIPTLKKKFAEWQGSGKPKPTPVPKQRKPTPAPAVASVTEDDIRVRDEAVWAEEGPVELPNIRDPRVRARVRRDAAEREARLVMRMMAAGLHVSQWGARR